MKLDEFKALIESQRKAQQLTNLEKIAKIVNNTNTTKGQNENYNTLTTLHN